MAKKTRDKRENRETPTAHYGYLHWHEDIGGQRIYFPGAFPVAVGVSPKWFEWLEINDTFHFQNNWGSFTARKEKRRNAHYWFAYKKNSEGKLKNAYLGKSEALTEDRLLEVCKRLN